MEVKLRYLEFLDLMLVSIACNRIEVYIGGALHTARKTSREQPRAKYKPHPTIAKYYPPSVLPAKSSQIARKDGTFAHSAKHVFEALKI